MNIVNPYRFGISGFDIGDINGTLDMSGSYGSGDGRGFWCDSTFTEVYMTNFTTRGSYWYTLSTAKDLSTASYNSTKVYASFGAFGGYVRDDGLKTYRTPLNGDRIQQNTTTTAFDFTSITTVTSSIFSTVSECKDLMFNSDGTVLWQSNMNLGVRIFTLSTGWDISTAVEDSVVPVITGTIGSVNFILDGYYVVTLEVNQYVRLYKLLTPYDLTTAVTPYLDQFDLGSNVIHNIRISQDLTTMFYYHRTNVFLYSRPFNLI